MRWMTDNLRVATDPAGNVKPDKANSMDKIDGWSALVTGMAVAMTAEPPKESVYERRDPLVI
jgi:phage terminase large subunit-like protein